MKVDTCKLKKGSSELTPECRQLIEQITNCRARTDLLQFLETVHVWVYGKCELYHWIEILDRFDKILEDAARYYNNNEFTLYCDVASSDEDTHLLLLVLNFTTLLIEHSFSRHLYNSTEHLTQLLSSQNMDIVLAVLNLLYMFSKRSNFIPRLPFEKKELLLIKLFNIAERWGDPNYGLALIDCCMKKPKLEFLYQFSIEFTDEHGNASILEFPDMNDVCNSAASPEVIRTICTRMSNPSDSVKMRIAHRVRLVSGFKNYKLRLQFVQARLQAVSVLIYSNALQDNIDRVLYQGFGEELCELIDKEDVHLVEIRAAVLRTLTSMLHFDRNPNIPRPGSRLPKIIQYTGAERQGGILSLLVRDCIASLTGNGPSDKYPLVLATSLFSLLYHLASYEAGGQALVKSGMMQSLLRVISWPGVDLEHITFVTRAVRVIDLITNIEIFHQNNGLNIFIDRLEKEVNNCRKAIAESANQCGSESEIESSGNREDLSIETVNQNETEGNTVYSSLNSDSMPAEVTDMAEVMVADADNRSDDARDQGDSENNSTQSEIIDEGRSIAHSSNEEIADVNDSSVQQAQGGDASPTEDRNDSTRYPSNSYYAKPLAERNASYDASMGNASQKKSACVTQRAALLKSMLNFLKKSIQDHAHFNGMRNIMETSLPCSLRHIISNAEYYGPSLFLLATDVFTVYVFNEPSLLSSLQDAGITSVMLQALLQKDVPATREVLGSLPNVFSAMCLNERGLMEFMSYEPFDKLLKVLLSPQYLIAMRRRRSSDPLGDTATNLGNAMDDLMKHHPYLRTDATEAIVRLLNELVRLGSDPNFICWRANKDNNSNGNGGGNNNGSGSNNSNGISGNSNPIGNPSNSESGSNENENDSSGDDDDEDDEMSSASQQQQQQRQTPILTSDTCLLTSESNSNPQEREAIPLIDYILNVMKFIEAIFNNSSNGEHCHEFVLHGGLKPLLQLLSLPNLPVDSPVSTTAQAVANVCKSILNLAHETKVIETALQQLSQIVTKLKPLIKYSTYPGGSMLLCELLTCPKIEDGFSIADYTPLLHGMSSVHGYVVMLVHLCRNASFEMRSILLKRWGSNSDNGLRLLQNLVQLYISLVWESTILLSLCSDEPYAQYSQNVSAESTCSSGTGSDIPSTSKNCEYDSEEDVKNYIRKFEKAATIKEKLKPEEQLRYIKALLAASSRLGRALAELFGTLVKLSVGTPPSRQRRNNDYLTIINSSKFPTTDAKEIARVLSSILVNGFNHDNIVPRPASKLKLTFLICSVGFTGPMLFDDKRSSFHLMISQFCEANGLKAFFDMFYWALSLDGSSSNFSFEQCMKMDNVLMDCDDDVRDFPEGTGEFLDAWLQLLEKMVNPRALLESPYAFASRINVFRETVHFDPVFYLIQIHRLSLLTIRRIWKRKPIPVYGVSMTETVMSILKHLVKSYSNLCERYQTRVNEIQNAHKTTEQGKRPQDEVNVNADHLKILLDMGFMRQYVLEALRSTRSLEQATDYLLNHPEASNSSLPSSLFGSGTGESSSSTSNMPTNEMEMDVDPAQGLANSKSVSDPSNSSKLHLSQIKLISSEMFNEFCEEAFNRTFTYMEYLPETVSNGSGLIADLYRRRNSSEKQKFLLSLIANIYECTDHMWQNLRQCDVKSAKSAELLTGPTATKLFIRLKVSTLLLDESQTDIRKDFCMAVSQNQTINHLLLLLSKTETFLQEQLSLKMKVTTPIWLQNLIEFIDAIDNVSIILQRKENMRAVCSDNWKWYDANTGKWNAYSDSNNILLKNAFNSGERSVMINIGRQRYTVNFNCMTQVSEASGSQRPVLPSLKLFDAIGALANANNTSNKVEIIHTQIIRTSSDGDREIQHDDLLDLNTLFQSRENSVGTDINSTESDKTKNESSDDKVATPTELPKESVFSGITSDLSNSSGKSITPTNNKKSSNANIPSKRMVKVVLHEESVGLSKYHTSQIMLRLVRLLKLEHSLNFDTKLAILKLCVRLTKDYSNAKVFLKNGGVKLLLNMRQSCSVMGFPTYAIVLIRHVLEAPTILQEAMERVIMNRTSQPIPVGHRDLIFVLTQISSAVSRHPSIFLSAAKQLRADYINPTTPFDESRLLVKTQSSANRKNTTTPININSPSSKLNEDDNNSIQASVEVVKELLRAIVQPCVHYGGVPSENNRYEEVESPSANETSSKIISTSKKSTEKSEPCCCSWHIPSSSHTHQKPVLPRSTLLKILADAVRSYQLLVPRVIVEHIYTPADSTLIEKDQSFLSFVLDNFLPIVRRNEDSDVSMMTRVLIASLSDCTGQNYVQTKVVAEIQESIIRTLSQEDSAEKHTRLQVLVSLLPAMIESPMLSNKVQVQRNNMYRILLRQGIMSDLAKIAQYKDLSNCTALSTVYSILRPMEILLRLSVGPAMGSKRFFFGQGTQGVNSLMARRFYPRISTRINSSVSNALTGEHVLRDIIRNVLSDRRHAYDFILNADDIYIDTEDTVNEARGEDIEELDRPHSFSSSSHGRGLPQLSFERLWDDLIQNEGIRRNRNNTNANSNNAGSSGVVGDHRHLRSTDDDEGNNENGVGGSDGASTSSEMAAVAADNAASLLGEPSSSDSDSDSNISTENDERNDEDDDDDEEDDGNEEGVEERSETDAEEESRQFIEVFDHLFESSESASNDADVDADDEASELNSSAVGAALNSNANTETSGSSQLTGQEHHPSTSSVAITHQPSAPMEVSGSSNNIPQLMNLDGPDASVISAAMNSIRTATSSSWVGPRIIGTIDLNSVNNLHIDQLPTTSANNERTENTANVIGSTIHINTSGNQTLVSGNQRREITRRLIFLDQQYCGSMPTFSNPTEEGQIELFNQDALHWWLEEAKNLDLESQTDACLYVAHLLIPSLIKDLKVVRNQEKADTNNALGNNASGSRRSAIPVLIPQMSGNLPNTTTGTTDTTTSATNSGERNINVNVTVSAARELSQFRVPEASAPRSSTLSQQIEQAELMLSNALRDPDSFSEDDHPGVSDPNEDDADDDDDYEDDDEDVDDEDDELNSTFMEEGDLNTTFNLGLQDELADTQRLAAITLNSQREQPSDNTIGAAAIELTTPNSETRNDAQLTATETPEQSNNEAARSDIDSDSLPLPLSSSIVPSPATSETVDRPVANVSEMSPEVRAALGDLEVPEGVDPSFLAALPSEMREEVIQEHLRMQRIRQRAQQNAIQVAHDSLLEVNPEFLAALPPNIQSEVLMQQRIEQQRQAAQSANPEDPVDTAAFFQNLPESLRQAILTDMEESQIASLPPDVAAEAQFLRRDWENRNGARLDAAQSNTLSGYLSARFPTTFQNLEDGRRWRSNSFWYDSALPHSQHHQHTTIVHHGHQINAKPIALLLMEDENNLLDPDALTTLLLFLFIEDPKLNYTRLHRVIRNLCYHLPTREWIIGALISIINKTNESKATYSIRKGVKPQWLKLRVDAAFGYKSNVFIINKLKDSPGPNGTNSSEYSIALNPQAAQMVVRNCLELLFVLAKHFPRSFVPYQRDNKARNKQVDENSAKTSQNESTDVPTPLGGAVSNTNSLSEGDLSTDELRAMYYRQQPPNSNTSRRSASFQTRQVDERRRTDIKLDETPSTSKAAAAIRSQNKSNIVANRNKFIKGSKYNTNSHDFWDVLLSIDLNTNQRMSNVQLFPVSSQPVWQWENKSQDFLSFNDSPFAKLLEMLPYKVICRSPQLTDMLVKLLASLSSELPKEEESTDQTSDDTNTSTDNNKSIDIAANSAENQSSENMTRDDLEIPSGDEEKKLKLSASNSKGAQICTSVQSAVQKPKRKMYSKNFSQLQLVIEVLTHQCGTSEGLDNISKLIVNLSQCSQASNAIFLQYLSSAIIGLAQEVRQAIQNLLDEIRLYNLTNTGSSKSKPYSTQLISSSPSPSASTSSSHPIPQGIMQDRFTSENIIISAPTNVKPSCELQLPTMKRLLSSSSAQPYFLRTLKIFMQVRDLFEAQENAIQPTNPTSKPTLSQIICLDELWNTLSDCLIALEELKDEYAVLVLQPTVEAFFLIHASQKKAPKKPTNSNSSTAQPAANPNNIETPANADNTESNSNSTIPEPSEPPPPPPPQAPPLTETSEIQTQQNIHQNRSATNEQSTEELQEVDLREAQLKADRQKFLSFAEKHRTVLNQILRQSPTHLSDGPFAVLVDHTRILDFDVKRKYFQTELERVDEGVRREENTVSVRRVTVFEDSFRVLYRLGPEEWKNRFYIVFEDEEGQDAGGLLREWYVIISREIFNPMYALFCVSPGDRVTYMINPSSHANPNHLSYFKFVGRVIAKAVHDNKLLECYFTRSFYKHILGKQVKHTDMESQDYEFYKGLDYLMKNDISTLGYELTFSTEVQEFGVTQIRDLIPNGRDIPVTEENKFEYVQLVCQLKMSGSIRQQLDAFLEGFYDIIPKHLISIFNEQELELLISGLPDIDIEDLKANTEYHKYNSKSIQIQWFWRALRSFDQADRAKFLQFVTGTSKVPLQGFGSLEGMNGIQKFQIHRDDRSTDRLPCAHTCFNQLDLPMYKSFDKLRSCLLKAIHECSEGFGFA